MTRISTTQRGFTMIELLLVMGIMLILISVSTLSLTNVQQYAYLSKSMEILLSDIKLQQTKAMNGLSVSGSSTAYGIFFGTDTYTLFEGDTYDPSSPTNFSVSLDGQLRFADVSFPNDTIVFAQGSGEVIGFIEGQNTIVFDNPGSSNSSQIIINRYGVFTTSN